MCYRKHGGAFLAWVGLLIVVVASAPAAAYDDHDRLSVSGVVALVGQCQRLQGGGGDPCRRALTFQPEISYRPAEPHELFVKLGFADGNALNDATAFRLHPWGADVENAVENVNGGSWDYVLTAWYRYAVTPGDGSMFHITGGIIDSTDYLDTNAYSNDEYSQFMNSALVNGPNVFVPSYSPGLAGRWLGKRLSLTGVYMRVSKPDGSDFDFYGLELGYHVTMAVGPGNYRLLVDTTSPDFDDVDGASRVRRTAVLVSCDQQLAEELGVFARFARQFEDAAVGYRSLHSAGVDLGGGAWGRPEDDIGVGLAHLKGGNQDVARTWVAEGYYRFAVLRSRSALALTADVQYMRDDLRSADGPEGWVIGIRATAAF